MDEFFQAAPSLRPEHAVGDVLTLGTWRQEKKASDPAAPIEWRVIAAESDRLLLLSVKALDYRPFQPDQSAQGDWAHSEVRQWLNETFLTGAFSPDEQARLAPVCLPGVEELTPEQPCDRVFLLSLEELDRYLPAEQMVDRGMLRIPARAAEMTARVRVLSKSTRPYQCYWWTRGSDSAPPADDRRFGAMLEHIDHNGYTGSTPAYCERCIRPAVWLWLD